MDPILPKRPHLKSLIFSNRRVLIGVRSERNLLPCNKGNKMLNQIVKKSLALSLLGAVLSAACPVFAAGETWYTLYKNRENFGILIFPSELISPELKEFVLNSGFKEVESGHSVMRSGSKNLNATFMMPEAIQNKYRMERFITLQVLGNGGIMVGVFDPEWGLTLPRKIFELDEVKKKVPQTLQIFRKDSPKKEI